MCTTEESRSLLISVALWGALTSTMHAAFYADCQHELRVATVFNCLAYNLVWNLVPYLQTIHCS